MTKLFGLLAVAAMTLIGCAKEIEAPENAIINDTQETVVETHTVTISAGAPDTKTVINEGVSSASFKWSSDDASRFHIKENSVSGTSIALETNDDYATIKLTATFATVSADSYTYTAFLAKNVVGGTDPQVPAAQTCTGTTYDPNADILIAQPVTNDGSVLEKLNMKFGRPCVINKMTLKGLTSGETVSSVEIFADKPLTGYYDIAGTSWTGESQKITLTTSQVVPASGQVVVYFVTIPVESAKLTVTAITDAHVYNKTFGSTINFVLDQVTTFGVSSLGKYVKRDVLTYATAEFDATSGSYKAWSGKGYAGVGHSDAVYAGQSCEINTSDKTTYGEFIQLRKDSPSGIISTTSGGSVAKVFVVFGGRPNVDKRALTVYGKNTAYTATTNLFSSETYGEEMGTLTYNTGDKFGYLNIESYCEHIGLLSGVGAMYFREIQIFWDNTKSDSGIMWKKSGSESSSDTATLATGEDTMPTTAIYNPNGLTISYSSTDESVATINPSTGEITLVGGGTTDIKATFAGNETYKSATKKYTLTVTDSRSTCETPSFSPGAGSVDADDEVTISSTTTGSTIYYTVDGSTPTTSSAHGTSGAASATVTIDVAKTVKAIAVKDDWKTSSVASATYTISGVASQLDAPDDVTITAMNGTSFTATWTKASNASGYSWKLSTSSNPEAAAISGGTGSIASGSTETVTVSSGISLSANTPYYLHIKSVGDGVSYSDSDYESTHIKYYSLTPDQASTGSSATSYITTLTEFTFNTIKWKMNQWNPDTRQVKTNQSNAANEFRFYNTSAFSGRITKVVITFSALSVSDASKLMFKGDTKEVSATSGGSAGTWSSTPKTLTWTPGSSDNYTYFAFYQDGKAASGTNYLAASNAIVVLYE